MMSIYLIITDFISNFIKILVEKDSYVKSEHFVSKNILQISEYGK